MQYAPTNPPKNIKTRCRFYSSRSTQMLIAKRRFFDVMYKWLPKEDKPDTPSQNLWSLKAAPQKSFTAAYATTDKTRAVGTKYSYSKRSADSDSDDDDRQLAPASCTDFLHFWSQG